MAETQTVLWTRILDRTRGDDPPRIVCVDPRRTPVAQEAERTGGVHLAPRVGTNLALMNGLTRELFVNGWVDEEWVAAHTLGVDELRATVEPYTPEQVAGICGVDADDVRARRGSSASQRAGALDGAAGLLPVAPGHRGVGARCNNLHLLRGMIGRPGGGVLQMNGQPTAQNNRECGADGDLPGFRNWDNPEHVAAAGRRVERRPDDDPALGAAHPRDADLLLRRAGLDRVPVDLARPTPPCRCRSRPGSARSSAGDQCFVVVQDLFLTETAAARRRGAARRRLGREDRHASPTSTAPSTCPSKAVEPPGRGAQRPRHLPRCTPTRWASPTGTGDPLIRWRTPEEAFDAWRECTAAGPCDYTGLSYDKLRGPTGIPWPVNERAPDGTDRLYADGVFPTDTDYCETYGHDLLTGGAVTEQEHRAMHPAGRAFLKGAAYTPPHEEPGEEYPLLYTTGRTVYQFHTRTKTGRCRQLNDAAPGRVGGAVARRDADRLGIDEGDVVRVESPPRRDRGAGPGQARHAGRGVRAVPLRALGPRRRRRRRTRPPPGQRADHDRLGPGVQAAATSRPPPAACQRGCRRAGSRTGADHRRVCAGPLRPACRRRPPVRAPTPASTSSNPSLTTRRTPRGNEHCGHARHAHRRAVMPHVASYIILVHEAEQRLAESLD